MEKGNNNTPKELVIIREFNAPRQLVFEAFTSAKHLANWWGPKGSEITVKTFDLKPGGLFHYSMKYPTGDIMWGRFVYQEIKAPERIVFVSSFADEEGNAIRAFFSPDFPIEIKNTWTFTEENGKTKLVLTGGPINAGNNEQQFYESMFGSMQQGFGGTFDQLEEYLSTIR